MAIKKSRDRNEPARVTIQKFKDGYLVGETIHQFKRVVTGYQGQIYRTLEEAKIAAEKLKKKNSKGKLK